VKLLFCFLLILGFSSFEKEHNAYDLTVKATGIKSKNGQIEFALYKDNNVFAKEGKTYKIIRKSVADDEVSCTFKDLPEGKYAVCIYHDANNNHLCDKNFFGIPTEAYGFSNNRKPILSIPTFDDCSVQLNANKSISIKLIY